MVSWLTCIIGSPGYSMRNRPAISWGDHHCFSQVVTWAANRARPGCGVSRRRRPVSGLLVAHRR